MIKIWKWLGVVVTVLAFSGLSHARTVMPVSLASVVSRSEGIFIATCVGSKEVTLGIDTTFKIEKVIKSPKEGESPQSLIFFDIAPYGGCFTKGERYLVFAMEIKKESSGGYHFVEIKKNGDIELGNLVCPGKAAKTKEELLKDINYILTGGYEKDLLKIVGDKTKDFSERSKSLLLLCDFVSPEKVRPLLISLIAEGADAQKPPYGLYETLFTRLSWIDRKLAVDTALNTVYSSKSIYMSLLAAGFLVGQDFPDFEKKHLPWLLKLYQTADSKDEMHRSGFGGVIIEMCFRRKVFDPQLKPIMLHALAREGTGAGHWIFLPELTDWPERIPAFWIFLKRDYYRSKDFISQRIAEWAKAARSAPSGKSMTEPQARKKLTEEFPKEALRIKDKHKLLTGWLFITEPEPKLQQCCIFVGWETSENGGEIKAVKVLENNQTEVTK